MRKALASALSTLCEENSRSALVERKHMKDMRKIPHMRKTMMRGQKNTAGSSSKYQGIRGRTHEHRALKKRVIESLWCRSAVPNPAPSTTTHELQLEALYSTRTLCSPPLSACSTLCSAVINISRHPSLFISCNSSRRPRVHCDSPQVRQSQQSQSGVCVCVCVCVCVFVPY